MRRSTWMSWSLVAAAVLAPVAVSWADPPAPSASIAPGASASAPGSATAQKPRVADDLPAPEATPLPTADEWKTAASIRLDRPLPGHCGASRVREWVRVSCRGVGASVGLVAGNAEGYSAMVGIPARGASDESVSYWAQFPVRRRDRRLIELRHAGRGNYDETLYATNATYLSIQWNDGEPPKLIVQ